MVRRMRTRLVRDFRFEAAHSLPNVPTGHRCGRMHGHSYHVQIVVEGAVDPRLGWIVDFADIDKLVDPVIDELDHHTLNEVPGLENPTSELLAAWLWRRLSPLMPALVELSVAETPNSRCVVSA